MLEAEMRATADVHEPGALGSEPRPAFAPARRAGGRASAVGAFYVIISALAFGSMPIFARTAYASGVDTETLLLLRFSIASVLTWVIFAIRRARLPRGPGLAVLVGMGAIGYAGQAFSYFTALTLASAGLTALLLYLYPALVAILSRVLFRHRLSRVQIAAIAMALGGSVFTVGRPGEGQPLGIAFAVLAAIIYAVYIIAGSRLPGDVTPTASTAVVTTAAAAVYLAVAAFRGVHLPATAVGWAAVVTIAVVCTVVAIAFFLAGLDRLGPVSASTYSTLEPVSTLALAALLLGERVTLGRAFGGALILAAVVLLARAEAPPATSPDPGAIGSRGASR
jgi:drug/metabolite transporter (DMT)-like permease